MNIAPLPSAVYRHVPAPADPRQVELGLARWNDRADASDDEDLALFMRALAADETGHRLLASIFGNSPFLSLCCLKEPALLIDLVRQGPDETFAELSRKLNREFAPDMERGAVMRALRIARRRAALVIAIADIADWWSLERVTGALSAFAGAALEAVVRHLLCAAAKRNELMLLSSETPERDSGFFALGLGKLGARELNYSSDIDLILLFDSDKVRYTGRHSPQQFFTRLAHDLVHMMAERTEDGLVFRTDLRLRPDPGSTAPALSVMAALSYYESTGQNWERAAMIKARPVAGDRAAGRAFLAELVPFLWRRHLDFAAIQDIHSIKRQINAHRGGDRIAVAGHNVKLGRGGIREIEFFAQTQQLIWGGRMPELRVGGTCAALDALAEAGRLSTEVANDLTRCYRYLRRVEHRLQMVDDAQTHSLPRDPAELERFAIFMGYPSSAAFSSDLLQHLSSVEGHYAKLFEEAPTLSGPGNLVFTGAEDDPDTLTTLRQLGFSDAAGAAAMVRGWHHGRYRATHSQRARELLTELIPTLLSAFGRSPNPDAAFLRFDRFLSRLPAGVQVLSLFYRNSKLVDLVAEIMGASPKLADQLARHPNLLEAVLDVDESAPLPQRAELIVEIERSLALARHDEDLLDRARRWVGDHKFRVAVALLRDRLDGETAGAAFADIAEAVILALLPRVEAIFARSHGTVPGGGLAVLGLGKLGSREMNMASDLDLILIYDAPDLIETSDGPHPLPVSTYFARLSQRFINALTAMTQEGQLYEVDMRLRPSGTAGPLASSLTAFRRYHRESAWTWERLALTRARLIAGPRALRPKIAEIIKETLTRSIDPDRLAIDVAEMRERITQAHSHPSIWDVKHRRGGLVDIEFIAQYFQLRFAAHHPELLHPNTAEALLAFEKAGRLDQAVASDLVAALMLWRNIQGILKLTVDEPFDEEAATPALKALLARAARAIDFEHLKLDMERAATQAYGHYQTLIAAPAAAVKREPGKIKKERKP